MLNVFLSDRPIGVRIIPTSTRNPTSIASVSAYTMPAPLNRVSAPVNGSVNSSPPTAGPAIFAVRYTVALHVTAFTKCSDGTRLGSIAVAAGPLNALPIPIPTSTT